MPSSSAPAELYAMLHRGNPGDLAFYRRICAGASTVLELGAGYGRVAVALARAGHEVVGLDVDEQLLALARQASEDEAPHVRDRVSWVCADMATLALGRTFDRVVVPYNALCCLLSEARVVACLHRIREHLAVDGLLALDVYEAEHLHAGEDLDEGDDFEPLVTMDGAAGVLDVFEKSVWEPTSQRLDTTYRFVPRDGGAVHEQNIEQRYLLADELSRLLADTGFHVLELAGGFDGEPFDEEAEHLVVVARRT